ncbi:hypothetical protein [Pseudomonas viridiflava]|uniref:hypothetical protein n=1 Tax=Pseudomonas viridiflava TaxID=33069 RepID=UPI000F032D6E|nr:hypothetical protein [Pseudomonas viridiflava]
MHATLTESLSSGDFEDLFTFLMKHRGPLTEPFAPEQIALLSGMGNLEDILEVQTPLALKRSASDDFSEIEKGQLSAILLYRLEQDEDALNWCLHGVLCEMHVAGNDAYLFDLIRELSVAEKLSFCAAQASFWGCEDIKRLHMPVLNNALTSIRELCKGYSEIEWLPTNENLLQTPADNTIASTGKMGVSAVHLEASPLNTLPRTVLAHLSCHLDPDDRARHAQAMKNLPIASTLWIKTVWAMGRGVQDQIEKMQSDDAEFDLDGLAREASAGVADWRALADHSWNTFYPSTWIDQEDVRVSANLLELAAHVDPEVFDEIRSAVAMVYHVSDIDRGYASGFPESDKIVKRIQDCPVEGVGKMMFMSDEIDPLELIDKHLDAHKDLIASSLISRSFSPCYSPPKAGIDLLAIINHTDPDKQTGLHCHAIVSIQLLTLKFLRDNEPEQDVLKVMGMVRTLLCAAHDTIDDPWPSAASLEDAYRRMPDHLQGPEARLSLGLSLTREQLQAAGHTLRASSFNIDLGL